MKYKDLFYFTGHCLALDEHPQFRHQIIELFAETRNIQHSTFDIQNFTQLCSDHLVIPAIYRSPESGDGRWKTRCLSAQQRCTELVEVSKAEDRRLAVEEFTGP